MRVFNYIKDYNIIGTTINGYITQMEKEIKLLKETNNDPIYGAALGIIEKFKSKYPNLGYISSLILKDLLEPNNVEYCMKYNKYPENASKLGLEFEQNLKQIIELEEQLKK